MESSPGQESSNEHRCCASLGDGWAEITTVRVTGERVLITVGTGRVLQGGQPPHDRRAARPIHGPGTYRPALPTDSQVTESLTTK